MSRIANLFSSATARASRRGLARPVASAAQRRKRLLNHEPLEDRRLMAVLVSEALSGTSDTMVVGNVYSDIDASGAKTPGDEDLQGWTVYLDLDNSGTRNTDAVGALEPAAVTNNDGRFRIDHLAPGTYRVAEVLQAGWTATSPVSQDVVVTNHQESTANFFNFAAGDIQGTVWNDLNADGIRATDPVSGEFTEPGLASWTIYLDLNDSRDLDPGEPQTLTDDAGHYSFTSLPAGDYEVTELEPDGWEVSPGFDNRQTVTVAPLVVATQDFANFSLSNGSLRGTIWNDANIDGVRNTDPTTGAFIEPGLVDWTVFLDTNNNRVLDAGETSATTNADGVYVFPSLPAGDYDLVEVLPAGWDLSPGFDLDPNVTVSAGEETVAPDFANFSTLNGSIRGVIWNDVNRNGMRDHDIGGAFTEPGLVNWQVYLDLNHNQVADPGEPTALTDTEGVYRLFDLQVGDYDVHEILPTGWEVAPTFNDEVNVVVFSGTESVAPDFANFNLATAIPGQVHGSVYNDLDGDGVRNVDPVTLAYTEPGLEGWTLYVDQNLNGIKDATEPQTTSAADGAYAFSGLLPGTVSIVQQPMAGWHSTEPAGGKRTILLKNGDDVTKLDFGNAELMDSGIRGTVYVDSNKDGVRGASERGLAGITVYLDANHNGALDPGEQQIVTTPDLFYTPGLDEAGAYSFTHLAKGSYDVRIVVPDVLSATPESQRLHAVTILAAENHSGVDFGAVYRPSEIHGVKFEDLNGNHQRDPGEPGIAGATVYIDLNRNDVLDPGEPTTTTGADGSYSFTVLEPGAYVVREIEDPGYEHTYPETTGGILWPGGVSNSAIGNVTPTSITTSLAQGEHHTETVSLTLPNSGALTNKVDVFLLFDDTGSFVNNSPIVRAAFPQIIAQLQAALPGIDLGFGVGRFEEYANFALEYASGRPFVLNQPVVAASTPGYLAAIQAGLNRTTPGYGGDQPETDIEALYQLVTGLGFDGNNNGTVLDSGPAGLASTQLTPGGSGDVPSFASFTPDPAHGVLAPDGNIGGGGFRAGALPIILTATDTGFAYQPKGESVVTGIGGLTVPISELTETSRPTTPFDSGAGFQQTVTGLNALGALVIGLGTNPQNNLDPRQGLESLSKLTGAVNRSTTTIANGTADPIAPGDPFYFQIQSGFASSVSNGVVNAIQNAVTSVAMDITVQASDPRVKIINHTGTRTGIGAGQTATFDIEFVGDGVPRRFDLQFVRAGTNVVLGSIPVVIGTPIPGDGYEFEDLEDGEIELHGDFGSHKSAPANVAPSFTVGADQALAEDAGPQTVAGWATNISPGPAGESGQTVDFLVGNDNASLFGVQPSIAPDGTLTYSLAENASGVATVTVRLHDNGGTAGGGVNTSAPQSFTITVSAVNDAPVANADSYSTGRNVALTVSAPGVLGNDSDVEHDALTAVLVDAPAHGTLALADDGSFVYTPSAGYVGLDSFSYRAKDVSGDLSSVAAVNLQVKGIAVTNANDSGPGSLRQAMLDASAAAGSDVIDVELPTGVHVIALASPLPTLFGDATLSIPAGVTLQAGDGGRLPLQVDGKLSLTGGGTFKLDGGRFENKGLMIDAAGGTALDLANGVMIVNYSDDFASPAPVIRDYLRSGFNVAGVIWDGSGIKSSPARDDAQGLTALAMVDNHEVGYDTIDDNHFGYGLPGGVSVPDHAVLVKFTYVGDADLNGRVDGDDLVSLLVGYATHSDLWSNGDFDYSGAVDGDDLTSLLVGYANQGGPLGASGSTANEATTLRSLPLASPPPASSAPIAATSAAEAAPKAEARTRAVDLAVAGMSGAVETTALTASDSPAEDNFEFDAELIADVAKL